MSRTQHTRNSDHLADLQFPWPCDLQPGCKFVVPHMEDERYLVTSLWGHWEGRWRSDIGVGSHINASLWRSGHRYKRNVFSVAVAGPGTWHPWHHGAPATPSHCWRTVDSWRLSWCSVRLLVRLPSVTCDHELPVHHDEPWQFWKNKTNLMSFWWEQLFAANIWCLHLSLV